MTIHERIQAELEREAEERGVFFPSENNLWLKLSLSDEEKEEFLMSEIKDNEFMWWNLEGNNLTISYSREE